MPSFVDIATLTRLTSITGNEEFQVSPTQKVTATQIANKVQLAQVLMGGFEAISIKGVEKIKDTNSLIGAMKILYSLSGNGRAKVIGNSENCFGLVSINTAGTLAFGILFDIRDTTPPSIFIRDGFGLTGGASLKNLTDDQWIAELKKGKKIPMESGSGVADPIQIHDFAEVSAIDNWPTPKDGLIIPFVTDSGVLNKPGNESEYVGIIICEVDTQNTGRAEVIAYGSGTGACYVGLLDYASVSIEWMVNKMSVAGKKLSAFTGIAIGNYIQSMGNAGDLFPFVTVNANKTTANQFPANGAWSGFVTIGDGGGVNIIAFKSTTDPNAEVYVGRCSGGTTQWTLVGGGSGGGGLDVINVPMGGDIGSIIAGANWKQTGMEGEMKAVFVLDPASVVGDYFPNLKNAQTLAGFAQCVYDGSDYQYFITTLFPYTDTLRNLSKEYGRILSETNGDVIDYEEYPYCGEAPIPGYSTLVNVWRGPLVTDSTGVINFNAEIPTSSKILVVAKLRSSTATTANVVANIPITFVDVNSTGQGIILDYTNLLIGKNNVPGSIRLICSSVITGATGVQGMNFVLQVSNVSDVSNILEIAMYSNR